MGVVLTTALVAAAAAAPAAPARKAKKSGIDLWNIDGMVRQAAEEIIRRYKLNDEQAGYTKQLLSKRVNTLLDKHGDKVRKLFREAMVMRMSGKPPTTEAIQSWSQQAVPIYQAVKREILEGNEEWGQILLPNQKEMHQTDIKDMMEDFTQYEQRLDRWSKGGFDAEKDWIKRTRRPARSRTRRPPRIKPKGDSSHVIVKRPRTPPAGAPKGPSRFGAKPGQDPTAVQQPQNDVELDPEHFWDVYVRNFVRKYRLDSGQSGQAQTILKDCKERARRHRAAHHEEYLELRGRIRKLRADGGNAEAANAANRELGDLDAPISDLFEELKGRLESIPTSAQLQKHQASKERR